MTLEAKKYLYDIDRAAELIEQFTKDVGFTDYARDIMLRSAVERQFEIVGEAIRGLAAVAPEVADALPDYRRIISFRNRLIHGYASVSNEIVWGIIESRLPDLRRQVAVLLADEGLAEDE